MATIREKGQPTRQTKGAVGDIYTNIITGKSYKCTNAFCVGDEGDYFWAPIESKEEAAVTAEPVKETKKPAKKTEAKVEEPAAEEAKNDGEPVEAPAKKQKVNYSKAFEAKED